jgi:hypothetical protein
MPYKHIAAHLNKTELACRLHYHQLSFGTKRRQGRRRTSSVSSARSSASNHSHHDNANLLAHQRPLPQLSPPASPPHRAVASRSQSPQQYPSMSHSYYQQAALHQQQGANTVPILPKPVCSTGAQPGHPAVARNNALRLITSDVDRYEERNRIDKSRLGRIYDAHRGQFWAAVARDYGENVPPHVLEGYWWRSTATGGAPAGAAGHFPPTPPNRSPQTEKTTLAPPMASSLVELPPTSSFRPVNGPTPPQLSAHSTPGIGSAGRNNNFAISSLLTEDKEVGTTRAPQVPSVAAH